MILLFFSLAAAIYYVPWILKTIGDWIHQCPLVKKLPCPKGLPVIGSLLDVAGDTTDELANTFLLILYPISTIYQLHYNFNLKKKQENSRSPNKEVL